jgi:GxxExxY protein
MTKKENQDLPYSKETGLIIKCFYKIYNNFGYGFINKVYKNSLYYELQQQELSVSINQPVALYYNSINVGDFTADIIFDNTILISIKSSVSISGQDEILLHKQLQNSDLKIGLLFNFGHKPEFCRKSPYEKQDNKIEGLEDFNDLPFDK